MLEDELSLFPSALEAEIGEIHMRRYEKIRQRMSINEFGRLYSSGASCPVLDQYYTHVDPSGPEKDFHKLLMTTAGRNAMYTAIGARSWAGLLHEHNMGQYGTCDFVILEGRIRHAVEIKMGEPTHSVISQIDKYIVALELDMCLGSYDKVNGIVIAEKFPPYISSELSRMGVLMVQHSNSIDSLKVIHG